MKTLRKIVKFIEDKIHLIRWKYSSKYRDWCWTEYEKWTDQRVKEHEQAIEADYQNWLKENEVKWAAENEEQYWAEQDRLQEEEYDRPGADAYDCPFCGYPEANCNCDEQAEDFSDLPCVDEEPLSPEMEYWNTLCTKCGMYPEFCWCGMEKLE